jgi:hypothetical protein
MPQFLEGDSVDQTLQFSGGEPVDKTFTLLTGRDCRLDAYTVLAGRLGNQTLQLVAYTLFVLHRIVL